jgi:ribose 5-phosphate isomerase A
MRLGLGTGSTAAWLVRLLAEKAQSEKIDVTCVPTSTRTKDLAESLGLNVSTLDKVGWLDLTIDGADEFDPELNLIKGGGGALLQEKIVASASDKMLVISDDSKEVQHLGAFPLPVEVVKFGWETTKAIIEDTLTDTDVAGQTVTLRLSREEPYLTDEGHYILDLHLRKIENPMALSVILNQIPGVVENGLFVDIADLVCIGYASGEHRIVKPARETEPAEDK